MEHLGFTGMIAKELAEQVAEYRKDIKVLDKEYQEREPYLIGYDQFLTQDYHIARAVVKGQIRTVYSIAKRFGISKEQMDYWLKEDNT